MKLVCSTNETGIFFQFAHRSQFFQSTKFSFSSVSQDYAWQGYQAFGDFQFSEVFTEWWSGVTFQSVPLRNSKIKVKNKMNIVKYSSSKYLPLICFIYISCIYSNKWNIECRIIGLEGGHWRSYSPTPCFRQETLCHPDQMADRPILRHIFKVVNLLGYSLLSNLQEIY